MIDIKEETKVVLKTIDAALLKKAFLSAAKSIERKKEIINELNVFPVPDGDTGTNMTMTIMSAAREVAALGENPDMVTLCKAISSGSLRGARGNSGVILSQLLRGFTKAISDKTELNIEMLADAFEKGVETAYKISKSSVAPISKVLIVLRFNLAFSETSNIKSLIARAFLMCTRVSLGWVVSPV